jgi:hypothetical protein
MVFDDARCRGADLKLRQNALGLLTVAPGLQKDKLMQVGSDIALVFGMCLWDSCCFK